MQLTIQDSILYALTTNSLVYIEATPLSSVVHYLIICGYRTTTAQAIAHGILNDKEKTIALAILIRLLAIS